MLGPQHESAWHDSVVLLETMPLLFLPLLLLQLLSSCAVYAELLRVHRRRYFQRGSPFHVVKFNPDVPGMNFSGV